MPDQPKTQHRSIRIDDASWEALLIYCELLGTDRSKHVNMLISATVTLGSLPPFPAGFPVDAYAERLLAAARKAESDAPSIQDPKKRDALERKAEELIEIRAAVLARSM